MATITAKMIVNDVVNKYPETMKTFNKWKVDSCCGGGESIDTTAAVSGVKDVAGFVEALNKVVNKES